MKIGIDATSLTKERITGIENYVRNLVAELSKIDSENQYSLYLPGQPVNLVKLPDNFKVISSPDKKFWSQRELPKLINSDQPDVVYFPTNIIPKGVSSKIVYHFHDLAWKYFSGAYSKPEYFRQFLAVKRAKKLADMIICGSQSAKSDLVKEFGFDPKLIQVVPLGFDPEIAKFATDQKDRSGIVFCGRLEARKNLLNILKAYKLYADHAGAAEPLYICGSRGYGYGQIKNQIDELQSSKYKVIVKGYLPPNDFYQLLGRSKALLFASLYEGFGLPILESFAAETAVITSRISSMPEVAGDAAILVDPTNINEISEAIIRVIDNDQLRSDLACKGKEQLKQYSWGKTARGVLEVLSNVK